MGEKFDRTRNRRKVDDFPPELRAQMDEMLLDPRNSYAKIAQAMTEQGYEIDKSSIYRYAKSTRAAAERLKAAADETRRLVQAIKDNQDLEATEVAVALLMDGLTNRIAAADEEFDNMPLDKAGRLLVQLQRTSVYKNRYKQDRKRTIGDLQDNIMARIRDAVQGDDELTDRLLKMVQAAAKEEAAKDNG